MAEPAFRGTLLLLQNRTRRDPESYRDEFLAQLEHFTAATTTVTAQRSANAQYMAVLQYLCHVCQCYPDHAGTVARIVLDLLRSVHSSSNGSGGPAAAAAATLPHELRMTLVKCAMLLRSRDVLATQDTFPVFFALLQERDKDLRRMLLSHIVNDIRRVNRKGVAHGAAVNRKAQSCLFAVMDKDDAVQARCAQLIMIDLYRRRVWCDERTVEVMTRACFSRHTTIVRTALRFFLLQMPKLMAQLDADGNSHDGGGDGGGGGGGEGVDPGRCISKLRQKMKIVKKTAKRERVLQRHVRAVQRRYQQQQQKHADADDVDGGGGVAATSATAQAHVDPVRLLRDPHQFVERLFARLQRTSERFEVRLLYLNVIARTVSEHEVVHLPLYAFLERYAEPSQLHATQLLALVATCVHRLVPPDAVEPLVRAIANHFVTDRASPDAITVGLNTLREVCKRQPLAMTADLLKDLVEYKNTRGERGVVMAARALLQLYRDVYPELLPAKLRVGRGGGGAAAGHGTTADGATATRTATTTLDGHGLRRPVYGATHVYTDIPGLELLYRTADTEATVAATAATTQRNATATQARHTHSSSSDDDDADDDAEAEAVAVGDDARKRRVLGEDDNGRDGSDGGDNDGSNSTTSSSGSSSYIAIDTDDDSSEGEWVVDSDADDVASDDVDGSYVDIASSATDDEDDDEEACPQLVAVQQGDVVHDNKDDDENEDDEEGDDEDDDDEENDDDDVDEENAYEDDDEDDEEDEDEEDAQDDNDTAAWYEDLHEDDVGHPGQRSGNSSRRKRSEQVAARDDAVSPPCGGGGGAAVPLAAQRMLTDEELTRLRALQQQQQQRGGAGLRGKQKERAARAQRAHALIHGVSADLSAHDVERFTSKKREEDRQVKIARAQELRAAKSPFEIRKRTKSKLNSTHGEHAKRGKLFQMTKRSQRVGAKLKSSVADRATRAKKMKKKDVKFRIRRGWKA